MDETKSVLSDGAFECRHGFVIWEIEIDDRSSSTLGVGGWIQRDGMDDQHLFASTMINIDWSVDAHVFPSGTH